MRRLKFFLVLILLCFGGLAYLIYDHGHDQLVGIAITEARCNGANCGEAAKTVAQNLVDAGRYSAPWKAQWCLGVEGASFFEGDDFISKFMQGILSVANLPCGDPA